MVKQIGAGCHWLRSARENRIRSPGLNWALHLQDMELCDVLVQAIELLPAPLAVAVGADLTGYHGML